MDYKKYEFDLLLEAIVMSLTKDKRSRGQCDRFEMIAPITELPDYFKDATNITDAIKKGDFDETKTHN